MSKFVLTAQLQLQAPRNSQQVLKQIQNQLRGVTIPVELKAGRQVQRQLQGITKETQRATTAAESLGRSFGLAVKRFAAFTVASRAVSLFTNSLANAVDEAISFQREIVKIAQVTGKTVGELKNLEKTITSLSVNLGVSSKELLSVGRILSQAGIKARDLDVALTALAKTTLAPTFENIEKTAEGAVAILAQFGEGVGALERQLGAINAVAGQFAVESGDLISAVRRFGGVFKSAGGNLEELLGLFTSVRATTRESGESIATGLRTIFTRIQRPRTIAFLKQFGVELLDVNGKFVGPLKAVKQLNKAFADLPQGDIQFVRIAEELGGFRQIGKVIPLIQQFEVAERARQAAVDGGNSLTKDAATAQQALAVQIAKVKEEFFALVRGIANDASFQLFTRSALQLASALIKIADALKPLLPLIGAFAAFKFARGLGSFGAGIGSAVKGLGKNKGGAIQKFARGGFVPGSGNRDTVPAMLTPGEFVIKKSSAQKLGAGTLQQMNENRFNNGTTGRGVPNPRVRRFGSDSDDSGKAFFGVRKDKIGVFFMNPAGTSDPKEYTASKDYEFDLTNPNIRKATGNLDPKKRVKAVLKKGSYPALFPALRDVEKGLGPDFINPAVISGISSLTKNITNQIKDANLLNFTPAIESNERLLDGIDKQVAEDKGLVSTISGYVFEGVITALTGAKTQGKNANFDFSAGSLTNNRKKLGGLFGNANLIKKLAKADAKATAGADKFNVNSEAKAKGTIPKKVANDINDGILSGVQILKGGAGNPDDPESARTGKKAAKASRSVRRNKGGGIPGSGDTVPALLTPGEFVVNKSAAQSIGYGNLNSMNKTGVARFNKGGAVQVPAVQKFQSGGIANTAGNLALIVAPLQLALSKLGNKSDEASDRVAGWTIGLQKGIQAVTVLSGIYLLAIKPVNAFGKALREGEQGLGKLADSADKASKEQKAASGAKSAKKKEAKKKPTTLTGKAFAAVAGAPGAAIRGAKAAPGRIVAATPGTKENIEAKTEALKKANSAAASTTGQVGIKKALAEDAAKNRDAKAKEAKNASRVSKNIDKEATSKSRESKTAKKNEEVARKSDDKAKRGVTSSERRVQSLERRQQFTVDEDADLQQKKTDLKTKLEENKKQKQNLEGRKGTTGKKKIRGAANKAAAAEAKIVNAAEIAKLEAKSKQLNSKLKQTNKEITQNRDRQKNLGTEIKSANLKLKENQSVRKKTSESLSDATKQATKAENKRVGAVEASKAALKKKNIAETNAKNAATLSATAAKKHAGAMIAQKRAADKAARAEKKLSRSRKIRAAAGSATGGLAKGGGIVAAVFAIGSQIASGFAEFFRRQERIAIASENSAKAIDAAGKAAQSENFGKAFSLEGIIRANRDPAGLTDEFASNIARSKAEAGFQVAQGTAITDRRKLREGAFTTGEGENKVTDFTSAGKRTIAAQNRARAEFGALSDAEKGKKEAEFASQGTQLITDFANSGASLAELERTADGLAGLNEDQRKQYQILIKTLVATREAQKAVNKANFDSLKITSAFGAAAAAVNNFTAGLETGSNTLAGYVSELEAAQQGIGIDASGAIDAIEQELISSAQGAGAGSLVSSLQGQADVARVTNQFGVGASGALDELELSTDTETAKGQLEAALLSAIPEDADKNTRAKLEKQIQAQVAGIENIQTADLSAVVKGVVDAGGKLSAGFQQAAKLQAQHNQVMIGLYKKQEELEAKASEAKNKAIDTQLEAAKVFEDFGGSKLTGQDKLGARVAQFNNVGGLGGLGAQLTSGSAGDIRQAQGKINETFFDQTNQVQANAAARSVAGGGPGAFAGAQGIRDDKREEAKKANAALITFTKQRIALLKEELSIVQKKNAEEKSALDKLISGDVEGFLEGQAAAGAGAALRSGDASLAGLFGTSALGAGFKSLEGQGLSDQQLRSAEDLTLQRFGIQSTGVLSGTTSEEQSLNSQGRELAGVFGDLAGDQAAFAQAEFTVQEAVINATNATFSNKLREVAEQNKNKTGGQSSVASFFRGGPVYANRGMFVPRGTDTVPAMLTPGEFVVNRSAVQRGNNMQILRAMNSGGGASGQSKMRGGGVVRYYQDGGSVAPAISPEGITQLQGVFTQFAESVDKLVNSQFSVKLDTTNVNVNFNGASFLSTLKDDIKSELLETVKAEIGKAKPNNSGDIKTGNTVLGN